MSNIYLGQCFTITLNTNVDVSGATTKQIHYKKPISGTKVLADASVVENTKLRITITDSQNDEHGDWYFHTYAIVGGKTYYGDSFLQEVKNLYT